MTRTKPQLNITVSKSVDDLLEKHSDNNKSALVDSILKAALVDNPTAVNFIIANRQNIPWSRVISIGLESIVNEIKQHQDIQRYTQSFIKPDTSSKPRPLKFVIDEALASGIDNWNTLVEYCNEQGHLINPNSPNDVPMNNRYFYHNKYLMGRTEGQYYVTSTGEIKAY